MLGFILYSKKDIGKNKIFIEMLKKEFLQYDVETRLIILEEYDKREMPDFVINRSRDYLIARFFEEKNIPVFNSSKVTEVANNKLKTYCFLKGIVPYMRVDDNLSYPYVLKSCKGHGGCEVFMIENKEQLIQAQRLLGDVSYLKQEVASDLGKDFRVYIVGNKIKAAVLRTSTKSFKSNFSLGGEVQEYHLNREERQMVEKILEILPIDYGGIDFIFDRSRAVFNEIEDAVGARMLYQTSDIDIVKEYTEYIIEKLNYKKEELE